ncbi:MAG: hypothetical protein ACFHVJ_12625 [Aestuariibacter sp.]
MKHFRTAVGITLLTSLSCVAQPDVDQSKELKLDSAFSILPITSSGRSFVLNNLEDKHKVVSSLTTDTVQNKDITTTIAKHQAVFLNAEYLTSGNQVADAYLAEAYKQGKAIIIENANALSDKELDALPALSAGDVVLIHPSHTDAPDKLFTYSAISPMSESSSGSTEFKRQGKTGDFEKVDTATLNKPSAPIASKQLAVSLNSMDGEKRRAMLTQLMHDLLTPDQSEIAKTNTKSHAQFTPNAEEELITANSVGGFSFAYPCPQNLKDAYECYAAVAINYLFNYDDGEKIFNGTRHRAYAMYKADGIKYVAFSMHGSANPTMTKDDCCEKRWYLEYVDLNMDTKDPDSTYASVAIASRLPGNEADTVALTSTSGLSVTSSLDSSGVLTSGVSFDQSNSVRKDITDWESYTTSPNGRDAGWRYEIKYPGSDSDWVSTPFFQKPHYKDVPTISKYGLQYVSEGIWTAQVSDNRRFHVDLTTKYQVKKRKITDRSIFHYDQSWWWTWWSRSGWTWLNLGWLQ